MQIRGTVIDPGERRSVSTQYGERELAEPLVRIDDVKGRDTTQGAEDRRKSSGSERRGASRSSSDPESDGGVERLEGERSEVIGREFTVTLWGKWVETAELLEPGMELLVTDVEETEFRGERGYATSKGSYVVLEPDFLVNVTDVRSWVQCPRMYYLNKLSGVPLNYPVVKGTIVHEVFGDLLRGREFDAAVEDRVAEAGLELGLLEKSAAEVEADVRANARAIDGWLSQGTLGEEDDWRSEYTLISERFGIKGRADALRRGMPVELKTGKNTNRDPRFQDKIQAACYALLLEERGGVDSETSSTSRAAGANGSGDSAGRGPAGSRTASGDTEPPDTGTLLYTKNSALDRNEATGDLSPAKEFSIGHGLLEFVVRTRNEIAAMEHGFGVPTGYEADAKCEYCFEQDTCMVVSGRLDQESKAGKIASALPEHEREYFDRTYRLIEEERRETHREYAKLWEQTPQERADDDRALIGLEPVSETMREDGRWELRARGSGAVSKLREGDVALASDGDPIRGHAELARIERLGEEVVVATDEPVPLRRLDVYPSDMSSDGMLTALHDALLKGDPRRKAVLFGEEAPEFGESEETFIGNNASQDEAVRQAVAAEDFALIHGPPGTGKTYTIARTIRALVERGDRVLLSAFTNRAVDNALEALRDQGFTEFVRFGTEHGVRPDMQPFLLERRGDPEERARELREASVVAATTASCGSRIMREQEFDVALVDEASQLTEPATLAAINRAKRFVLVGDHHQLPPVVRTENELSRSLFERLIETHPEAGVMLDRQYRMAQRIQSFSSREFYDGKLRPATGAVARQRIDDLESVSFEALPEALRERASFVDVEGDDGRHTDEREAGRIAELVERFAEAGVDPADIGVIAPFRAQVTTIDGRVPEAVTVDTVDRFQGSSKEVVIVSLVASDSADMEGPIFDDYRRVNVALTRAKKSLVLVGTGDALRSDDLYGRIVDWAER
ncbi:AAA domain-containing protein [Halalkalicoccus ordinarius]|uniref:AAA domain-containing protein n=1 Tax=Halalkalicoccus ordinarius TaxID=3116651 RepID=UPI0039082902